MINVNETEKNVNAGHRKRVREAFLKRDIDSMAEHEILEMLLFYAYTRKDTNKIAHRLINRFGSLQGVFSASYEDLIKVDEVGEAAASLIVLFSRISAKYNRDIYNNREKLTKEKLFEMLNTIYRTETEEVAIAIFCDGKGRYINMEEISRGTSCETSFNARLLVETAFRFGAGSIILAHNHPRSFAVPSQSDAQATREVKKILNNLDIRLDDHIIIAEDECYSMKDSGKFDDIFLF